MQKRSAPPELSIVISKTERDIPAGNGLAYVIEYTSSNDITDARNSSETANGDFPRHVYFQAPLPLTLQTPNLMPDDRRKEGFSYEIMSHGASISEHSPPLPR